MNWKTILAAGAILFTGTLYAQTPDGETPANEGVCDPLMETGISKGLYGLCVAFCESHDCEPDWDALDPVANCKSASTKILRNYNRKKTASDPTMPCLIPPPECPCFTYENVVDALVSTDTVWDCYADGDPDPARQDEYHFRGYVRGGIPWQAPKKLALAVWYGGGDPGHGRCLYYNSYTSPNIRNDLTLVFDEVNVNETFYPIAACFDLIDEAIANYGCP